MKLIPQSRVLDEYMTVQKCITYAGGAQWVAIEFGRICRFGNAFVLPAPAVYPSQRPMSRCDIVCQGDTETWCGGGNLMSLYEKM